MGLSLGGALKGFATGGWGGALAGGFLGGGDAKSPGAYGQAAGMAMFTPWDITTGMGTATFDKGKATGTLAEPYQGIVSGILPQLRGAFQMTDPRIAGLGGQALTQAGGAFGALGAFDPTQAAQERYGALEAIMAPSRERTRSELEARLLRQGRLGSTGGGVQQQSLESAFAEQQQQQALAAYEEARAQQQHLMGLGTGLGAFGTQMEALPFQRAQSLLGVTTGLEKMPIDLLRLGGTFGQAGATAGARAGEFLTGGAAIEDKMMAGKEAGYESQLGALGDFINPYLKGLF